MLRTARAIGILGAALGLAACGGGDDGDGNGGDPCSDAPAFVEVTAFQVCSNCHSSTKEGAARNGAPDSINFDTYAGAAPNAGRAASQVRQGKMPPPASDFSVTSEQRSTLEKWSECGAPRE
jgi:uncharacterized membrane protein